MNHETTPQYSTQAGRRGGVARSARPTGSPDSARRRRGGAGLTTAMTAGLAAALAGASGCAVPKRVFNDVQDSLAAQRERNAELQQEIAALEQQVGGLRGASDDRLATLGAMEATNAELQAALQDALTQVAELERALDELPATTLTPRAEAALARLASRYPSLITYDAELSRLRFASDLTFASGSDQVQDAALTGLGGLAEVLANPDLADFELVVVGHTDSVPISDRTRQRFPTNVHLSVARAISVRRELVSRGVDPERVQAAGWGEHRPAVPNNPGGATRANRRVEIFIRPLTHDGLGAVAPAPIAEPRSAPSQTPPPAPIDAPPPIPVTK